MDAEQSGLGPVRAGEEFPPVERGADAAPAAQVPYTWPRIAISNDKSAGVADADAEKWTEALADDILKTFGPRWHIGGHFEFVPAGTNPPAGRWVLQLLDNSDQAGALGYHDLTPDGLPLGKIFAGTDRQYGDDIGVTLDHELKEILADPWINLSAEAADGRFFAWEDCDAVEADALGYEGINGFRHSAFVTPAWFGSGAGPVSYPEGRVSKPFEIAPGGYISVFDPSTGRGWTQLQARTAPSSSDPTSPSGHGLSAVELIRAVPRVGSRRERRFRGRDAWVVSTYEPS